jgi:hypothetical protein
MLRSKRFTLRRPSIKGLVALGLLLLMASLAPAQRLQLPAHEQLEVNHAIDRGVAYLKKSQQKNGTWANPRGNWAEAKRHGHYYAIGFTALPGLTLLECGEPASDPIVLQAAHFVRSKASQIDRTYELSLAILFLDRLGDPKDKKLIQTLALRLIAGQSATGGWGYRCPLLSPKVQMELLTALRHLDPTADDMPGMAGQIGKKPGEMAPIARVPGAPLLEGTPVQPAAPSLSGGISRSSQGEPLSLEGGTSKDDPGEAPSLEGSIAKPRDGWRDCLGLGILDNKHPQNLGPDLQAPAGKTPPQTKPNDKSENDKPSNAKAEQLKSTKPYVIPERLKRLPVMQDPTMLVVQDPVQKPDDLFLTTTDNSNTQFAILALWRAQQYEVPTKRSLNLIVRRYQTSQNADGSWGYYYQFGGGAGPIPHQMPNAMTCVGLIGLAVGHGLAQPRKAGQLVQDARIINGLIALSNSIGQPVENRGKVPMQNLYFLWSLERVAVLYNLPTIGDKHWYRWGAQVLVRNQQTEGFWAGGLYIGSSPPLDTCLALLFLKRANLVKDLTAKLPFSADDLNSSIMGKTTPPPEPTELPKQTKKPELPKEPPKSEEPTPTVAKTPPPPEVPVSDSESESSSGKKKALILSLVLFLIFSGGSLFFILLAINRRNQGDEEEKQDKPKKRSLSREPKASVSRSSTNRG